MKKIIRHYIVDTFALWTVSQITEGLFFEKGLTTLLLAGVGLTAATLVVRPLVNILILPLNLITFGLFKWVSSAIALYLVTLVVPGFAIVRFFFAGMSTKWLDIPAIDLSGVVAYVAFSLLISIITSLFYWLIKS